MGFLGVETVFWRNKSESRQGFSDVLTPVWSLAAGALQKPWVAVPVFPAAVGAAFALSSLPPL